MLQLSSRCKQVLISQSKIVICLSSWVDLTCIENDYSLRTLFGKIKNFLGRLRFTWYISLCPTVHVRPSPLLTSRSFPFISGGPLAAVITHSLIFRNQSVVKIVSLPSASRLFHFVVVRRTVCSDCAIL